MVKLVESFEEFIATFDQIRLPPGMNLIYYVVLKTEGDIFVELQEFDIAIKVFTTVKKYLKSWGHMEKYKLAMY